MCEPTLFASATPPGPSNKSLREKISSAIQDTAHFILFCIICAVSIGKHYLFLFAKRKSIDVKSLSEFNKKAVYVITGCDSGFGNLLSKALVQQSGVIIVSLCLTTEAAKELEQYGIIGIKCDVTSDDDVQKMKVQVEQLLDSGKNVLHSIVNNAGVADPGEFLFYNNLSAVQKTMDVNFMGQLRVTQALLPLMIKTSPTFGGRVINMSSVCGATASVGNCAYNASKFAVEAWSDSLRQELVNFNIKVVKIRPGQFSTDIQKAWAERLVINYLNSSQQVRDLYGQEAWAENARKTMKDMGENEGNPHHVVEVLVSLLAKDSNLNELKPHYWLGDDAKTIWRALAAVPTEVSDSVKRYLSFKPIQTKEVPPPGVVSHVTIRVRSIQQSLPFYEALGMTPLGDTENGMQLLTSGSSTSKWNTCVMLKEDPAMASPRGRCYEAGMTRLCILTRNHDKDVKRLVDAGFKPVAPTAVDKTGGILISEVLTAFTDPDGFIVYLVQFKGVIGLYVQFLLWKRRQQSPSLFHWTINVSSIDNAMNLFGKLGFKTIADQVGNDQVASDLLPAFNIDPATCVIDRIRICHLPNDNFCATLMKWVNPKSEKRGWELSNSMTISVHDVAYTLETARLAGLETKEPEELLMPVFGRVMVGQVFVEPGSASIEVCSFSTRH